MKKTTVVIMQPYFLPYRNYYGLISKADHFVIFDDVQFCRGWQQRNQILSEDGMKQWLTLPVISNRPFLQTIKDTKICNKEAWRGKILYKIRRSYYSHPYFEPIYSMFEKILQKSANWLIDITIPMLIWSSTEINFSLPQFYLSSELKGHDLGRTERLIYICQLLNATEYLCGPAAKVYLDENLFESAGIKVTWHEDLYRDYPQRLSDNFDHFVSVTDLLMNCGSQSNIYLNQV